MKKRECIVFARLMVVALLFSLVLCFYGCAKTKFEVIFDYNDGSGMSETVLIPADSYISKYAPTIERANKRLVGWSLWKENGTFFTQKISKNITLYAQWEDETTIGASGSGNMTDNVIDNSTDNNTSNETTVKPSVQKHKVTFDYNNGSGKSEILYIPSGSEIYSYAPYPISGNSEVVGWSLEKDGVNFEGKIEKETTLYANWYTYEVTEYGVDFPLTINSRFVEIKLNGNHTAISGKVLRIAAGVKSISIISDGTVYDKFAIIIDERMEDLNITFDNFAFQSNQSFGIKGESEQDYTVNLEIKTLGGIECAKYSTMGSERAADCIDVPNLKISGNGTLFLYAGNGENGIDKPTAPNGYDGENGTNGKAGGHGIITNTLEVSDIKLVVSGGNGGKGGDGGNGNNGSGLDKMKAGGKGGNGGNGGNAVCAENIIFDKVTLELTGGNGGNGGDGGNGGAKNSLFSGLTGGGGGKGGNGGNGGWVFSSDKSSVKANNCVEIYEAGQGGNEGVGGDGLVDGKDGSCGSDGKVNY